MNRPVRILYVDDYPLDRELVRDALEKENGGFELVEAASRADFETALAQGGFDLVLSDFNILGFEGLQVLEAVHASGSNLPVIIVTGTGSEEIAVDAMKRGAAEYVIKSPRHIQHLPITIHAVLEKKHLEEQHEHAERERRDSEERYRLIFENSGDAILLTNPNGTIYSANPEACRIFQWNEEDIRKLGRQGLVDTNDPRLPKALEERRSTGKFKGELNLVRKDGTFFPADISTTIFKDSLGNERTSMIIRDMTDRKQAEKQIQLQLRRMRALNEIDRAISSSLDMRLSLDVLLDEVLSQLGVDAASVLLLNTSNQTLEYFAGKGFRVPNIRQSRVRLGEGMAGKVGLERKVLHVPDLITVGSQMKRAELFKEEGFVEYFGVPLVAKGMLKGVLEVFHRTSLDPDLDWLNYLETLGGQAAIAIDNVQLFEGMQQSNLELITAYDATLAGWSHAMDLRDKETEDHTQRIVELTLGLAERMGVSGQELVHIRRGALLHDIGKLGVPDHILLKPGQLTEEEWAIMRQHPTYAFNMLLPITYLRPALDIPYCHHEKWDGSGYPRGLKDEQIPLVARIFAVVDVWDALCSDRPYRKSWSNEQTRAYILEQSGKHFDPRVVEVFLGMIKNE